MRIGGFQKQSLIEFPGKISAVVFTIGCNFRCSYCHNPSLVLPPNPEQIPLEVILDYLFRNRNLLDALTVTGGEPTIQVDLDRFIGEVKEMGYTVKLETNGTMPDVIQHLIDGNRLDFVAMDLKAPLNSDRYSEIAGIEIDDDLINRIERSINVIRDSGIDHEFRTTRIPDISDEEIEEIKSIIPGSRHVCQEYLKLGDTISTIKGEKRP